MTLDNDAREMDQETRNTYAEGKKDIKDAWVDTKAAAEKAGNEIEAEADKL